MLSNPSLQKNLLSIKEKRNKKLFRKVQITEIASGTSANVIKRNSVGYLRPARPKQNVENYTHPILVRRKFNFSNRY